MRTLGVVLCLLLFTQGWVFAQLLDEAPVSTGGNPVGTWEAKEVPIRVFAVPELLASVSSLTFTGTITGQLELDSQGAYTSDYIVTSTAMVSILIVGIPLPISVDVADTNRATGAFVADGNTLILNPTGGGVPDTLNFSVNGNTLTLVEQVPLSNFAATIETLAPGAAAPLAIFDMTKVVVGHSGPITADFTGDGAVDFSDFVAFAQNFGKQSDAADFDARFDLNGSGAVDFGDFISFAQQFGLKT